jgi:hypothetical protein
LDVKNGNFVQEYWRDLASLHINKKELLAAINSVKSLSKKGETVSLTVDNQVVYYYLAKGGGRKILSTSSFSLSSNGSCNKRLLFKFIGSPQFNVWQIPSPDGHKTGGIMH